MTPMPLRSRARFDRLRCSTSLGLRVSSPLLVCRRPLARLAPTVLVAALALAGCGGGGSSDVDGATASGANVGALTDQPRDDAVEIAATRSALASFLDESRLSAQPATDRATALLGGGGRRDGGTTPGGGGGVGGGGTAPAGGDSGTPAVGSGTSVGGSVVPSVPVVVPGGPQIDASRLLAATLGLDALRIRPTNEATPAGEGTFRVSCAPSHMNYDDPVVFPGQPGRSHLHTYFGNTGANARSTAESLRNSGNSTCSGGIANRSAYWVPTMIDTKDGAPVVPAGIGVYYKNGYVDGSIVQPIPAGLRMIAGNASATGPTTTEFSHRFKCIGGPRNQNDLYLPTIGNCDAGAELWQEIFFPACWDGKNLDSPDHKSHMSYNVWSQQRGYHCPASHPVPIPQITFNVIYLVPQANAALRWRLASDTYSTSLPGGYSSHGDWFNGWIPEISDAWVRNCVQARRDCHSHLLGDGRMIF